MDIGTGLIWGGEKRRVKGKGECSGRKKRKEGGGGGGGSYDMT